jgi:hypothetical protein
VVAVNLGLSVQNEMAFLADSGRVQQRDAIMKQMNDLASDDNTMEWILTLKRALIDFEIKEGPRVLTQGALAGLGFGCSNTILEKKVQSGCRARQIIDQHSHRADGNNTVCLLKIIEDAFNTPEVTQAFYNDFYEATMDNKSIASKAVDVPKFLDGLRSPLGAADQHQGPSKSRSGRAWDG